MLRRPITILSITAEDVADFEDRRAERLEAQRALRHRADPGVLRDPRLQRIQGGSQAHPGRGHAAGWEYDSDEDEEEEEEEEDLDNDDEEEAEDEQEEDLAHQLASAREQARMHQARLAATEPEGQMDIDMAPVRGANDAFGRLGALHATPVAASAAPVTPNAPGAPEHGGNPNERAAQSPSEPPEGAIRTRIRVNRSRPTREERIGIAPPPAPDRRRRQQGLGPGHLQGGGQP